MWEIGYDSTTAGLNFTGDYRPQSSFVTVTAVPEPATLLLVAAALTCLTVRRPRLEKTGLERGQETLWHLHDRAASNLISPGWCSS